MDLQCLLRTTTSVFFKTDQEGCKEKERRDGKERIRKEKEWRGEEVRVGKEKTHKKIRKGKNVFADHMILHRIS